MTRSRRNAPFTTTLLSAGLLVFSSSLWASEWRLSVGDGVYESPAPSTDSVPSLQVQSPFSESLRLRLGLAARRFDSYVGEVSQPRSHRPGAEPIAGALLDYHFNHWGLRFTGGALYSTPAHRRDFLAYDASQHSEGQGMYDGYYINRYEARNQSDQVLPYLGLGWGRAFGTEERFQLKMDFGIAFQGVSNLDGHTGTRTGQSSLSSSSMETYPMGDELRFDDQFESLRYSFSAGVRYQF